MNEHEKFAVLKFCLFCKIDARNGPYETVRPPSACCDVVRSTNNVLKRMLLAILTPKGDYLIFDKKTEQASWSYSDCVNRWLSLSNRS